MTHLANTESKPARVVAVALRRFMPWSVVDDGIRKFDGV
jgi:hypothetical protein